MKKLIALTVAILLVASNTGCSTMYISDVKKLPLVPELSDKEVADYYKQSMSYDNIVTRNIDVHKVEYETKEVSASTKGKLEQAQQQIERELYYNNYNNSFVISKAQHGYIKSVLDDKILKRDSIVREAESLGYYFIDVKYNIAPKATGTFTDNAKYLGIHGAFKLDSAGNAVLDRTFLSMASANVTEYIQKNGHKQTLNINTPAIQDNTNLDNIQNTESAEGSENADETTIQTSVINIRKPLLDIGLYNKVSGSSLTQTALMPELNVVYTPSAEAETISGYGIFPQGSFNLKKFGYNRNSTNGTAILRYVFKNNVLKPEELQFVAVYPISMEIEAKATTKDQVIPQFVEVEIQKLIERSDRAISNNDIAALMNGQIHQDIGIAVRNGVYQNSTYLMRNISKLNKVLNRIDNNYLIEVETMVQEGPKGTQSYGTYRDTYIMAIEQIGSYFTINDYVCTKIEMISEPMIELDNSITKRLVALGLRGEISKEDKDKINELLSGLYKASTERKLKPMYDSFNSDTALLSSAHKEYLNAQLREWLTKHGVETKSNYNGIVSEWIGGNTEQAELITEELIDYEGKDTGQYMQMYYLVSSISGKWVIDEMQVLEAKDVTGAELSQIKQRMNK